MDSFNTLVGGLSSVLHFFRTTSLSSPVHDPLVKAGVLADGSIWKPEDNLTFLQIVFGEKRHLMNAEPIGGGFSFRSVLFSGHRERENGDFCAKVWQTKSTLRPLIPKAPRLSRKYRALDKVTSIADIRREIKLHTLGGTGSPYIVGVLDHYEAGNFYVLSMEKLCCDLDSLRVASAKKVFSYEGLSLSSTVFPLISLYILPPILNALCHLAKLGIVHLDIKPRNILVGRSEAPVKLADFGAAAQVDDTMVFSKLFDVGKSGSKEVGSLGYIAPEMLAEHRFNHYSDIWSLGIMIASYDFYDQDRELDEVGFSLLKYHRSFKEERKFVLNEFLVKYYKSKLHLRQEGTDILKGQLLRLVQGKFMTSSTFYREVKTEVFCIARDMISIEWSSRLPAERLLLDRINCPKFSQMVQGWSLNEAQQRQPVFKLTRSEIDEILSRK